MRSRIFSFDMVKAASKKQLWLPCLLALAFFMAFPAAELMMLDEWESAGYTGYQIGLLYENLWRDGLLYTGFYVAVFAAVLNGVHGFLYLHSPGKVDFYHSLPIHRTDMFLQKTWLGLLYTGAPYLLMVFASVCVGAARGLFSLKIMGMAAGMAAVHLLIYLMVYFTAVLAVVLTGKYLSCILVMGILFGYAPMLAILIRDYRNIFYRTAVSRLDYGILEVLCDDLSPVVLGYKCVQKCWDGEWVKFLFCAVLTVVITGGLSMAVYRRRPSESAGSAIIYNTAAKIIKIMTVIPCGMGIGLIFWLLFSRTDSRTVWWWFGLVSGTIFVHGVIEVMYQGEFRKFFSKKAELAAAGTLALICALWYSRDLGSFDTYLPARDQIKEFYINASYLDYSPNFLVRRMEDGKYDIFRGWEDPDQSLIPAGSRMGEDLYGILTEVVSEQKTELYQDWTRQTCLEVKYVLNSGRTLYREYFLSSRQIYDLMFCSLQSGNMKDQKYSYLCLGDECLGETVQIESAEGSFTLLKNQEKKYSELMDALRLDVEEASAEELLEQPVVDLNLYFKIPVPENVSALIPGEDPSMSEAFFTVKVFPCFKRTIDFVNEMGYSEKLDSEAIDSIEIIYTDSDGTFDSDDMVTQPEQIRELGEGLVMSMMECSWIEYDERVHFNCIMKNGSAVYCSLLKDKIPDFLSQRLEEKIWGDGDEAGKQEVGTDGAGNAAG